MNRLEQLNVLRLAIESQHSLDVLAEDEEEVGNNVMETLLREVYAKETFLESTYVGDDVAKLADLEAVPVPVLANLDQRILAEVEHDPMSFSMRWWHCEGSRYLHDSSLARITFDEASCGTRHCRAGWAVHLAGEAGYALEAAFGPALAGAMIYLASTGTIPNFYTSDAAALASMRAAVTLEKAPSGG